MEFRDFIYVDNPRLNSYTEQAASPFKYDKILKWNASLSLKGPNIGVTQEILVMKRPISEKIGLLIEYLKDNDLLVEGTDNFIRKHYLTRRHQREEGAMFVMDTFFAAKARIPFKEGNTKDIQEISLWFSSYPSVNEDAQSLQLDRLGFLCLMEDFRGSDEKLFDGALPSAYTILESILYAIGQDLDNTVLGEYFPPQKEGKSKQILNRLDAWWRTPNKLMGDFILNPSQVLSSMGCTISQPRKINSLYRIRDLGPEIGSMRRGVSVFGYPIFICAL